MTERLAAGLSRMLAGAARLVPAGGTGPRRCGPRPTRSRPDGALSPILGEMMVAGLIAGLAGGVVGASIVADRRGRTIADGLPTA